MLPLSRTARCLIWRTRYSTFFAYLFRVCCHFCVQHNITLHFTYVRYLFCLQCSTSFCVHTSTPFTDLFSLLYITVPTDSNTSFENLVFFFVCVFFCTSVLALFVSFLLTIFRLFRRRGRSGSRWRPRTRSSSGTGATNVSWKGGFSTPCWRII